MTRTGLGTLLAVVAFGMTTAMAQHHVQTLNDGWRFLAGDVDNGEKTGLNDSGWREVIVPHDFQIEQPWVAPAAGEKADNDDPAANIKSRLSSRGFKEMGKGWYRLHMTPADSLKGRRLLLDFGGIMYVGDVYVNGKLVGSTDYGYVGFQIDVTNELRFGQDNVVAVCADTREPGNSRWYTGGGLFREVKLVSTNRDLYFERHPLKITTRENRYVTIAAEVASRGRDKGCLWLCASLTHREKRSMMVGQRCVALLPHVSWNSSWWRSRFLMRSCGILSIPTFTLLRLRSTTKRGWL